jgi:hypothetical protein
MHRFKIKIKIHISEKILNSLRNKHKNPNIVYGIVVMYWQKVAGSFWSILFFAIMCVKRGASTLQDNLNHLFKKAWQYAFVFHFVFFFGNIYNSYSKSVIVMKIWEDLEHMCLF